MDFGIGRDTDGVSNGSTGGVTFSIGLKQVYEHLKHANEFTSSLCSGTKHNIYENEHQSLETECKTSKTKPVFIPKFPFPVRQSFYPPQSFQF